MPERVHSSSGSSTLDALAIAAQRLSTTSAAHETALEQDEVRVKELRDAYGKLQEAAKTFAARRSTLEVQLSEVKKASVSRKKVLKSLQLEMQSVHGNLQLLYEALDASGRVMDIVLDLCDQPHLSSEAQIAPDELNRVLSSITNRFAEMEADVEAIEARSASKDAHQELFQLVRSIPTEVLIKPELTHAHSALQIAWNTVEEFQNTSSCLSTHLDSGITKLDEITSSDLSTSMTLQAQHASILELESEVLAVLNVVDEMKLPRRDLDDKVTAATSSLKELLKELDNVQQRVSVLAQERQQLDSDATTLELETTNLVSFHRELLQTLSNDWVQLLLNSRDLLWTTLPSNLSLEVTTLLREHNVSSTPPDPEEGALPGLPHQLLIAQLLFSRCETEHHEENERISLVKSFLHEMSAFHYALEMDEKRSKHALQIAQDFVSQARAEAERIKVNADQAKTERENAELESKTHQTRSAALGDSLNKLKTLSETLHADKLRSMIDECHFLLYHTSLPSSTTTKVSLSTDAAMVAKNLYDACFHLVSQGNLHPEDGQFNQSLSGELISSTLQQLTKLLPFKGTNGRCAFTQLTDWLSNTDSSEFLQTFSQLGEELLSTDGTCDIVETIGGISVPTKSSTLLSQSQIFQPLVDVVGKSYVNEEFTNLFH